MTQFNFTLEQLCQECGFSIKTLYRFKKQEVLRPKIHFIAKGLGTTRPRLMWNLAKVQEALINRSKVLK